MGLAKNPSAYADVALLLDAALNKGGGELNFDRYESAIRWRARAYMLRTILRNLSKAEADVFGLPPSTPYDNMFLKLVGNTKILISFIAEKPPTLTDSEGNLISLEVPKTAEDELEDFAMDFAEKL